MGVTGIRERQVEKRFEGWVVVWQGIPHRKRLAHKALLRLALDGIVIKNRSVSSTDGQSCSVKDAKVGPSRKRPFPGPPENRPLQHHHAQAKEGDEVAGSRRVQHSSERFYPCAPLHFQARPELVTVDYLE
jgi:hypothetical protein